MKELKPTNIRGQGNILPETLNPSQLYYIQNTNNNYTYNNSKYSLNFPYELLLNQENIIILTNVNGKIITLYEDNTEVNQITNNENTTIQQITYTPTKKGEVNLHLKIDDETTSNYTVNVNTIDLISTNLPFNIYLLKGASREYTLIVTPTNETEKQLAVDISKNVVGSSTILSQQRVYVNPKTSNNLTLTSLNDENNPKYELTITAAESVIKTMITEVLTAYLNQEWIGGGTVNNWIQSVGGLKITDYARVNKNYIHFNNSNSSSSYWYFQNEKTTGLSMLQADVTYISGKFYLGTNNSSAPKYEIPVTADNTFKIYMNNDTKEFAIVADGVVTGTIDGDYFDFWLSSNGKLDLSNIIYRDLKPNSTDFM